METSKLRDTLCDESSGIAECDVPLGNLEGYDSPQVLPTSQSTSSPIQVTIFSPSENETQSPPSFSRSLSGTSQSPSTLASASNPATPQLSLSRYSCEICSMAFNQLSALADHYRVSHCQNISGSSKPYSCGKHSCRFSRRVDFERHLRSSAHSLERYRCRCGKQFLRPDRLRAHAQSPKCRGRLGLYACLCGHAVESFQELSSHVGTCDKSRPPGRPKRRHE